MEFDAVDVVIPARNEAENIGKVLSILSMHPGIGHVIVIVDGETTDETAQIAKWVLSSNSAVICSGNTPRGKGQCVRYGLGYVHSPYVLLMDADITGLTYDHVSLLLMDAIAGNRTMTLGVPDVARNLPPERIWSWRWVTGQRCLPSELVKPLRLIGYLMETQINRAAKEAQIPLRFEWLRGLQSKYDMSERRLKEMQRDAEVGKRLGIL